MAQNGVFLGNIAMHRILCLSLLSLCGLAAAQSMRPGLWEASFTMKARAARWSSNGARAQEANLPPSSAR
jgi:hypothetical protein